MSGNLLAIGQAALDALAHKDHARFAALLDAEVLLEVPFPVGLLNGCAVGREAFLAELAYLPSAQSPAAYAIANAWEGEDDQMLALELVAPTDADAKPAAGRHLIVTIAVRDGRIRLWREMFDPTLFAAAV